ncbi:hypothetical protein PLESTB_001419600 [Pleodorina starrii]|uniref:Uncharacterized protein n=1 Tax=Pleodorina starrii TaxID=330485 RepID=A0A9W6BW43_9CHLO|nr:hypothetical protein PLESTM_001381500 [Pleodorina starrii]GLC58940.1 hypothetical protein PLESTB_001419600 [Pleodorina starrii]GLC65101.1 hypothetical protein PLESTF_000246700 [Pleodorina starrii]
MAERKAKRIRVESAPAEEPKEQSVSSFLQSWAWKREHRPDRDRFQRPYVHSLTLPGTEKSKEGGVVKLTVEQARFRGAQGFASTVWDSSIVVAKMLERNPDLVAGRAVLDLSAGCGLVAVVAARLGARRTVATDLGPNLPLLRRNCQRNGAEVEVLEHWWGTDVTTLLLEQQGGGTAGEAVVMAPPPAAPAAPAAGAGAGGVTAREAAGGGGGCGGAGRLDVVFACDVMYREEVVGPLVATLAGLCGGRYDPGDTDSGGGGGGDAPPLAAPAPAAASPLPGLDKSTAATATSPAPTSTLGVATKESGSVRNAASGRHAPSSKRPTVVILAHGRNRFAEAAFWRHATAAGFRSEAVPWDELDPVYRCTDVDVHRLWLGGRPAV